MPFAAEGYLIDPPVSLPKDPKHNPAEVATPDPLDEEPAHFSKSHGFLGANLLGLYPPIAPSVVFNLPKMIAPASYNFFTTVESNLGMKFSRTSVPPIVLIPFV